MDDLQIEFDFLVGKNEVNSALNGIKKNAAGASSSVDVLGKSVNKTVKEFGAIEKTGNGIGSIGAGAKASSINLMAMGGAAVAAAGSIAAVVYAAKEFVGSAIEAEENVSRLNVALNQTGLNGDAASKKFQDLASAIQETTIYSDDQALSLIATLQTIGQFTEKGLVEATKASIELASAFKMDLSSAAALVGKAATGNVVALQKLGIEIKKGKTDSETFANTLEALSRLSGSSSAELQTLGGSAKYLGNQMGEVSETMGFVIADLLHLKDASILTAKAIKEINADLKEKPKEAAFDIVSSSLGRFGLILKAAKFAYKELVDEVEKNPIKARINAEKGISALPIGTQKIFDTPFEQGKSSPMLADIAIAKKASNKLVQERKGDEKEIRKEQAKTVELLRKEYLALYEQIKDAGKSQKQVLLDAAEDRINKLESLRKKGAFKSEKEFADAKLLVEQDLNDKLKKLDEERVREASELQKKNADQAKKDAEDLRNQIAKDFAIVGGAASNVLNGREGARPALSSGIGAVSEALLPGSGAVVGQIAGQLMQGPEATKAAAKEFAAAIPELVKALVEALPVFIEEINKQLPVIVQSLADLFGDPQFWVNFSKGMLKANIAAAQAVPKAFIQAIPEFFDGFGKELINAIVNGISQAVGSVGDVAGDFFGGVSDFVSSVPVVGDVYDFGRNLLGFARGGSVQSVPNGFPNDTFPAMLSSGELVVDRSTVEKMNDFMDSQNNQQTGLSDVLLSKILDKLSEPQNVNSSVTLNGREFANIILELNRSRVRLA